MGVVTDDQSRPPGGGEEAGGDDGIVLGRETGKEPQTSRSHARGAHGQLGGLDGAHEPAVLDQGRDGRGYGEGAPARAPRLPPPLHRQRARRIGLARLRFGMSH